MRRFLLLSLLLFVVAGCASLVPGQDTKQRLFAAQTDFVKIVQPVALAYVTLKTCSDTVPMPCKSMAAAIEIKKADDVAVAAFLEAQKFPTDGTLVEKAISALAILRTVLAAHSAPQITGKSLAGART